MEVNTIDDWLSPLWPVTSQPSIVSPPDRLGEFANAIEQFAPGFTSHIPQQGSGATDWIDAIAKTATALAMTKAQRDLLEIQLDRARQGLPPLDSSQYGLGATVGVSPETIKMIALSGGALILLWFVLNRRKG